MTDDVLQSLSLSPFPGKAVLVGDEWFYGDALEVLGNVPIPLAMLNGPVQVMRGEQVIAVITRSAESTSGRHCVSAYAIRPATTSRINSPHIEVETALIESRQTAMGKFPPEHDLLKVAVGGDLLLVLD